jgi:hypothetical protein
MKIARKGSGVTNLSYFVLDIVLKTVKINGLKIEIGTLNKLKAK